MREVYEPGLEPYQPMRLNESLSIFFIKRTSSEMPETQVTNARDQPCIHGTRDCIFSMHGTYAGRRR